MAITAAQAAKINKMNRASKDASLGTAVRNAETAISATQAIVGASGSYTAVAADASNAVIAVATGLATVNGVIGQVRRSGSPLGNMVVMSGSVAGTIIAKKDPTVTGSSIAANDVLTWIAF